MMSSVLENIPGKDLGDPARRCRVNTIQSADELAAEVLKMLHHVTVGWGVKMAWYRSVPRNARW